jgi:hypothetical protein
MPSGARFFRCALQVNPFGYLARHKKTTRYSDEDSYNRAIVEACLANSIEVIAITDHYRVKSAQRLANLATDAGIVVFPAFEAVSKDGIHVLCLFDPGTSEATLERYIGACGVHDNSIPSPVGALDLEEFLVESKKWGAICIAAHVDVHGGLLEALRGQPTVNAWRSTDLLACAISAPLEEVAENVRTILANRDPAYHRPRRIAIIHAKDVTDPDQLSEPSASSWIKMSTVTIEGLRQAFLDPESRIRLSSDPVQEEHMKLIAIAWDGGFLDGARLHFNENLNVLIGGRGAGKSTVVESIRYVLGLEPVGADAKKAHEGIVRQVLQPGTKVSLLVRVHRPTIHEYLIERTVPNPPLVRTADSGVVALTPADVAPQTEIFGQHEISEISKSREKLTRLLERFVVRDSSLARRKQQVRRELERSRQRLVDVRAELAAIQDRLAALPGMEETLRHYREAGLEERLKDQSLIVREERVLESATERINPLREAVERLRAQLPIDSALLSPTALADLPGRDILAPGAEVLDHLSAELEKLSLAMQAAIDSAMQEFAEIRRNWDQRRHQVQASYEEILRDLQRSRIDGEEFIRLRRQIEELLPLRERQSSLTRLQTEYETERRNLLAEWEETKAKEFRQLQRAAQGVSRQLEGRVLVRVTFSGNREPLFELLRALVAGRLSEAIDGLRTRADLSLAELSDALRSGPAAVEQRFGIPHSQAERLSQAPLEAVMQVEELELAPTTEVSLNVAGEGQPPQWQALEDLSTGQKATAVLLLLLLESKAPLIVDQPEDDLDNRFITEGVVPKMREGKRLRQFVFSTHNANIPVLGDAELIIGLIAKGEAGRGHAEIPAGLLGSIDADGAREFAEEILEGGKEAFEWRRLKYGF